MSHLDHRREECPFSNYFTYNQVEEIKSSQRLKLRQNNEEYTEKSTFNGLTILFSHLPRSR